MNRYTDPTGAIQASIGDQFAVELAGNPTTGYSWQARVDGLHLELVGQEFEPGGQGVGAGGMEVFVFRAVAAGEAEIAFDYRRPWDKETRNSKRFRVSVSG